MDCKNCNEILESDAHFCDNCGAKVIKSRITFRYLMTELFAVLGLDNLYFKTLKKMIIAPQEVLNEYLNGVRKRYVLPFAYLAIGAGIALIIFNFYADEFIKIQSLASEFQTQELRETAEQDLTSIPNLSESELKVLKIKQNSAKQQLNFDKVFKEKWYGFSLKYLNLLAFILLPFYSLISKLVYRKPHNYGEHLIMNAYIQGTAIYITILFFFLGLIINPKIYQISVLGFIIYYSYVFGKLYNFSFKKIFFKFLKFIGVFLIIVIPLLIILGIIIGVIMFILNPEMFKPV